MVKKLRSKNSVLTFDLGGSKLAAAMIDLRGNILCTKREAVRTSHGPQGLVEQMLNLAETVIGAQTSAHASAQKNILAIGIASAGPLDPVQGRLLNPTNLKTQGESWGIVELKKDLGRGFFKKFGYRVAVELENDAAASAQAEFYLIQKKKRSKLVGSSRGSKLAIRDLVSVTLGTGLGVGVIVGGQLVRAGRGLHPEAGHICMDVHDRELMCGCGNYGCAESFISGVNFIKRLRLRWHEPKLTTEVFYQRLQIGEQKALSEMNIYAQNLAQFIFSLVVVFAPQAVVISGGFSHLSEFFLPECKRNLTQLLRTRRAGVDLLPHIYVSDVQDDSGLIGAWRTAILRHGL